MRTKQLARQAVVAAFLEGALNPPLEDPHRKMRLKTAHGWLPFPRARREDSRRSQKGVLNLGRKLRRGAGPPRRHGLRPQGKHENGITPANTGQTPSSQLIS